MPRAFHVMAGLVVTAVDRGATWYPFAIADDQWTAVFEVDSTCAITEKFQQTPATLQSFLTFLESNAQIDVTIPNNKVVRTKAQAADAVCQYGITEEAKCVHKITQKFSKAARGVKPTFGTLGALVNAAKVKESDHVKALCKMT